MVTQNFNKDFEYLVDRIFIKKQHTSFARYADGEVALMLGRSIGSYSQACQKDKWTAPEGKTKLGEDLIETLKNNSPDKFYAISCRCCDPEGKSILQYNLQQAGVKLENITFSNLWINANYKKFKKVIENITEDVILIANKEGVDKTYPFKVVHFFPIENDCVNFWEKNKERFLQNLKKISSKPCLYLISAGPLSEVIIDFLVNLDTKKVGRYVDVGSALDEYTKGYKTRPYMIEDQSYHGQNCEF